MINIMSPTEKLVRGIMNLSIRLGISLRAARRLIPSLLRGLILDTVPLSRSILYQVYLYIHFVLVT